MNPLSKSGKLFKLPPGMSNDRDIGSSSDSDENEGPPVSFGKGKLTRQDTFYDVDYKSVKVSTVPQSQEGWSFFLDMLKTEQRKFQLMVTTLRIERGKILKEFEQFNNLFNEAKLNIKAQFETTIIDLRAVNCARLLNGEINKRSSSFIKTTIPLKAAKANKNARSTSLTSSVHSALNSIRETFGHGETWDDDEEDEEGMSTKSERMNRPTIPMEYEVEAKVEVNQN